MLNRLSLPSQLILLIVAVFLIGGYIPVYIIRLLYSMSLLFKELLGFLLPFMVFSFVLNGIISLKKGAPLILLIMLTAIFCSNAFVAFFTYGVLRCLLPFISGNVSAVLLQPLFSIEPLFTFSIPPFVPSEKALLAAVVLGLLFSWNRNVIIENCILKGKKIIEWILLTLFIPFLPLYVLGFLLKIHHEGMLGMLAQQYGGAFVLIVTLQAAVLVFFYWLAAGFSLMQGWRYIVNALPSYITAFGTMSSTATVPVSIVSAVKNTHNEPLAQVAMPIMANVHLLGDSVGIPVLALVSMNLFLATTPTFVEYSTFVFYFCTTMFAVSGIPGGAIIVMIPILVTLFNFDAQMISVITALYVLLDPFETGGNVMGDGALVIILDKITRKLGLMKKIE